MTQIVPCQTCSPTAYHGEIKRGGSDPITIEVSPIESSHTVEFVKKSRQDNDIQLADLIIRPCPNISRDELLFYGYFLADVTRFIERDLPGITEHFLPALSVSDRQYRCIMQNDGVANNQYLVRLIIGHKNVLDEYLRTGHDSLINSSQLERTARSSYRELLHPDEGND